MMRSERIGLLIAIGCGIAYGVLYTAVWGQDNRPMHDETDPYAKTQIGRMCCSRKDCRPVAPGELRFHVREDGEPGYLFTDREWGTGLTEEFVAMAEGERVTPEGMWQYVGPTAENLPSLEGAHVCLMKRRRNEFQNWQENNKWYVRCLFLSEEGV